MMKKMMMAIAAMLITVGASAQDINQAQKPEENKLDRTEMIKKRTDDTVKKYGLNALSFYISANNLFCLTKYTGIDPEFGTRQSGIAVTEGQTPRAKSYTLGVTVGF